MRNSAVSNDAGPESAPSTTPALAFSLPQLPPNPKDNKRRGQGHDSRASRELEKSEAITLQCQHMKWAFEDPEQVLKLSLQKVNSLLDKVESRLTDDLTAIYQEAIRTTGPQGRATKAWKSSSPMPPTLWRPCTIRKQAQRPCLLEPCALPGRAM